MKNTVFFDVNDGSQLNNFQLIVAKDGNQNIGYGSSILATGTVCKGPTGQLELKTDAISLLGLYYPIDFCYVLLMLGIFNR